MASRDHKAFKVNRVFKDSLAIKVQLAQQSFWLPNRAKTERSARPVLKDRKDRQAVRDQLVRLCFLLLKVMMATWDRRVLQGRKERKDKQAHRVLLVQQYS